MLDPISAGIRDQLDRVIDKKVRGEEINEAERRQVRRTFAVAAIMRGGPMSEKDFKLVSQALDELDED